LVGDPKPMAATPPAITTTIDATALNVTLMIELLSRDADRAAAPPVV
jgi:hypothetical protein